MDRIDEQYQHIAVKNLKGIGPRYADRLNNLGLYNVFDLMLNLPFRYLDKTRCLKVNELKPDGFPKLIEVKVLSASYAGRNAKIFEVNAVDDSGAVALKYFNIYPNFAMNFTRGIRLQAFGQVKYDNYTGVLTMYQPEVIFLRSGEPARVEKTLTPIYHLTDKLPQRIMQKIESDALQLLKEQPLTELLPAKYCPQHISISEAIAACHHPLPLGPNQLPAPHELPQFTRIAFEELTAYLTSLILLKAKQAVKAAPKITYSEDLQQKFIKALPFAPTGAQLRVMNEIFSDLGRQVPMLRLVNGDVGSGKTLIAIAAALHTAANGLQTALLAPTEILAKQHYQKCADLLEPLGVHCAFISSKMPKAQRNAVYAEVKAGTVQLVIGTHAVFQEKLEYKALALIIIDEQHRFGVEQRSELLKKGVSGLTPHQLTLTATPIPRTLQLALYSELAVSKLDEIPKGRSPIITAAVSSELKNKAVERLRCNLAQGVQAYWVCPLIEDTEELSVNSVKETYAELSQVLPEYSIGLLHGQMNTEEKNEVMEAFASGKIQLLIATTIIEVGVDVPNATIMIIDSAQRLGLAQLHQLRGRVGRGQKQSYCLLIYDDESATEIARQRLEIMKKTTDGFAIAAEDLRLRGPGDAAGTRQAGFDIFRIADVVRDLPMLEQAKNAAAALCQSSPENAVNLVCRWFPGVLKKDSEGS